MTLFADKLKRVTETISRVSDRGVEDLALALENGRGRPAFAVGSGGSAVAAEYLARCRSTLGLGQTAVMTPMQFVVGLENRPDADVWLFSAGGENPDIVAAFEAAIASRVRTIRLVTVNAGGRLATVAGTRQDTEVIVLPVADPKDGFLATHSMVSTVCGLLLAAGRLAGTSTKALADGLSAHAIEALSAKGAGRIAADGFRSGDTIVLLHDPQLAPVAILIETCLWETGLAPVQRTDFRNFAHGRHVWAARHAAATFVVALTSDDSRGVWHGVSDPLPEAVRRRQIHLGDAGRLQNAIGVFAGLAWIDAIGDVSGVDPGRPGHGPFAHAIYEDRSLRTLGQALTPAVRHKAAARALLDSGEQCGRSACAVGRERIDTLTAARFTGLVLDYDGTVVDTGSRYDPPAEDILGEIRRFIAAGVPFGIATGRGGSVGEMLRSVLSPDLQERVIMGYYNGGHIQPLAVDIRLNPPASNPDIQECAAWLKSSAFIRTGDAIEGRIQLTLPHNRLVDMAGLLEAIGRYPAVADGRLRVLASQHSFDVVPQGSSKLALVEAIASRSGGAILTVGDSGAGSGNDYDMLARPHGVSVGSVCGGLDGCWSVFGQDLVGPQALLQLLRSARIGSLVFRIDIEALGLDGVAARV